MSPLGAARRLVNGPCPTYWDVEMVGTVGRFGPDQGTVLKCAHCRQKLHEHATDCLWLAMPKVVAVMEAAEAVARAYDQETVATFGVNLGSPLLAAVEALDKTLEA